MGCGTVSAGVAGGTVRSCSTGAVSATVAPSSVQARSTGRTVNAPEHPIVRTVKTGPQGPQGDRGPAGDSVCDPDTPGRTLTYTAGRLTRIDYTDGRYTVMTYTAGRLATKACTDPAIPETVTRSYTWTGSRITTISDPVIT